MIIYGIKNCDKVRAALKQCAAAGTAVSLHDFRVDGIEPQLVKQMLQDIPMDQLVNKRSTTWRQLDEQIRNDLTAATLVNHPTLIKRPVVYAEGQFRIGL